MPAKGCIGFRSYYQCIIYFSQCCIKGGGEWRMGFIWSLTQPVSVAYKWGEGRMGFIWSLTQPVNIIYKRGGARR